MSSKHEQHSIPDGKVSTSNNQKEGSLHGRASVWKWRRVLLLSLVFILLALVSLAAGKLGRALLMTGDYSQDSLESGNASMEEVTSLECCREPETAMSPSNTVECALKMFNKQSGLVSENMESGAYCSSAEVSNAYYRGLESFEDMKTSFFLNDTFSSLPSQYPNCNENKLQLRELHSHATISSEGMFVRFAKICLWILIGMAISYNLRRLYDRFRFQKHEMRQPSLQQIQQQQQVRSSSQSCGKWRKKLLVVFVFGGVITSFWLFWSLNEDIMLRRKGTLATMCDERARMLQDQFNVSMNHVHSLAILISTFHHGKQPSAIDQKTFEDYTERTAFERPLTSGVAYALRVCHFEREHIEKQYGWTIKKMDIENQTLAQDYNPESLTTSPVQDEYAPVIFSQKTVSHIVSIDMMSGKEDRENILRARASGKGVLTSPFKLLKSNHLGVVLTFAVYNTNLPLDAMPEERINATMGYLGASYDVPSLVKKLLRQLASKQTIIVNVYDTTSQQAPIKMYGSDVADARMLHISNLDFGDPTRKHEMRCRFKHKPPPPWQAITVSVGVFVITLLLGHIFRGAINQIAEVEHDYQEMMELKHRAEAADVAKSQFLATVSHEIRTPMNGVLGMLQMLMDTNLDSCQLNYAQTAHDSGKDLISLISKVLDQAKIESGRLELEAMPFDLRSILDKVLSIFSGKSHEKGIELAVYVSDKVPEVVIGDQERFGQIVSNLVGNSIKFTHDKGHIFLSVHLADEVKLPLGVEDDVLQQSLNLVQDDLNASFNTLSGFQVVDRWKSWENFENLSGSAEESGRVKLLVTVEDTGSGIPPEAQCRIFTPFMQADSSTSRKYGGTGIGLSISKCLVDLMGGEIGFVSELNIGSTFTFTVTFTKAEACFLEKMWQHCDSAISEFQGLRALVIDRKMIRAQVTRYHLQRLGISVDIASGMESICSYFVDDSAASIADSKQYAMVLIDQEYWDDTCFLFHELMKTMRRDVNSEFPLKIFLLVTSISPTERNKLKFEELVDKLITKPLRLSSFVSSFREASEKRVETSGESSALRNLLNGKEIVVVDDNAVNRRVAEGALKKYGAVVTCVEGGKFAVGLLKPPHKFNACFMDLQMPEMDGFKATEEIRKVEKLYTERNEAWHTPIVAMTADVTEATNEACIKCGMDNYITKPFGEGQLYSAVAPFFEGIE